MTSKLCPHIQVLDAPTLAAIERVQPPMVKMMHLDRQALLSVRNAAPETLIVGRRFTEYQGYESPFVDGVDFANRYAPVLDLLDVVEVYNEPVNNQTGPLELALLDTFQTAFAERIWEMAPDVEIGLFCLPTGNFAYPGEPTLHDFPATLSLPKDKVYICIHEYSYPTWDWESPARCLRYRRIMEGLDGYRVLITECGLTQAVLEGHPDVGWRTGVDRQDYINGARWYNDELQKDTYVLGAAMFTCGQSYGWDTFESTAEWQEAATG